jgi:hypothetical protein
MKKGALQEALEQTMLVLFFAAAAVPAPVLLLHQFVRGPRIIQCMSVPLCGQFRLYCSLRMYR